MLLQVHATTHVWLKPAVRNSHTGPTHVSLLTTHDIHERTHTHARTHTHTHTRRAYFQTTGSHVRYTRAYDLRMCTNTKGIFYILAVRPSQFRKETIVIAPDATGECVDESVWHSQRFVARNMLKKMDLVCVWLYSKSPNVESSTTGVFKVSFMLECAVCVCVCVCVFSLSNPLLSAPAGTAPGGGRCVEVDVSNGTNNESVNTPIGKS